MVVGQAVEASGHVARVVVLLDGLAQRIGRLKGVGDERGDHRTGVHDEVLTLRVGHQPVQEVLGPLALLVGHVVRGVDEEVLRTAANQLGVEVVVGVLRDRHDADVVGVVVLVDDGPIPVAAEQERDLALGEVLLGDLTLGGNGRILRVVVVLENVEGVHQLVELVVAGQVDVAVVHVGEELRGAVRLLLVDLGQEVAGQRPVFLHDAGRGLHAAVLELLDQALEGVKGLVVGRVELLAGDGLDGVRVVHQAAGLDADREAEHLAAHGDGLGGVADPVLIAQVDGMVGAEGVDVLGVDHRQHVRVVGGVAGGQVGGNRIAGEVDLGLDAGLLRVLLGHVLELGLDLGLRVEDGQRIGVPAGASATTAGGQHADGGESGEGRGSDSLP